MTQLTDFAEMSKDSEDSSHDELRQTYNLSESENAQIEARYQLLQQVAGDIDVLRHTYDYLKAELDRGVGRLLAAKGVSDPVKSEFDFDARVLYITRIGETNGKSEAGRLDTGL